MNTQYTQWHIDSFPWRRCDEYMNQINKFKIRMRTLPTTPAKQRLPIFGASTGGYIELWSHRLLNDGIINISQ